MYRLRIRRQGESGIGWDPFLRATIESVDRPQTHPEVNTHENDRLDIQLRTPVGTDVRLYVERVLVASTLLTDRVLLLSAIEGGSNPTLVCRGRLFSDAIGPTEMQLRVRPPGQEKWHRILTIPVTIKASKFTPEQFEQLFSDLQREAAGALMDIHGKMRVGMSQIPMQSAAPVAVLARLHTTVRELSDVLHQIARQPASRLHTHTTHEQAYPGQGVNEATLAAVCEDPSMLSRQGSVLVIREQLREYTRPDYHIPEHRTIADFAAFLFAQLADLRQRIDTEIAMREERRAWRNLRRDPNAPSWWETEDKPRIEELHRCKEQLKPLRASIEQWFRLPFLVSGSPLRHPPPLTPLFRNQVLYRRAWRTMAQHYHSSQATLDLQPLLTQVRSLPVLYQWWCAVRVLRILASGLIPLQTESLLAADGRTFSLEFKPNQSVEFGDALGHRLRYRYEPVYTAQDSERLPCVLDSKARRTPDLAIEIFAPGATDSLPELILIFDAKYTSRTPWEKMLEVASKYGRIGDARTGRILSRQVWALTPTGNEGTRLSQCCEVDNTAFWSPHFNGQGTVNGALVTLPVAPGGYDPLRDLLRTILRQVGVHFEEGNSGVPQR
ncbi:MAG: DUF2357 domain-containing protein [Gemmataceae bacterium]